MRDEMAPPAPAAADFFGDSSPVVVCTAAIILMLAISVIDKLTGYDLQVSILYLVPVAMVSWTLGRTWGLGLSVTAAGLWVTLFRAEHHYSNNLYFYWDGAELLVTFVVVALLVARLREALHAHEFSLTVLETLDAPAYVVDLQRDAVLVGNREFREAFAGRAAEDLARHPARESRFRLADGRPALLRILTP